MPDSERLLVTRYDEDESFAASVSDGAQRPLYLWEVPIDGGPARYWRGGLTGFHASRGSRRGRFLIDTAPKCRRSKVAIASARRRSVTAMTTASTRPRCSAR